MKYGSFFFFFYDPDVDFYVNHARLDKIDTAVHQHQKAQLIYAEGGIVHVFVNERHWYLPARCYMLIPANCPHSILSYSKNISIFSFYFKVKAKESMIYDQANT